VLYCQARRTPYWDPQEGPFRVTNKANRNMNSKTDFTTSVRLTVFLFLYSVTFSSEPTVIMLYCDTHTKYLVEKCSVFWCFSGWYIQLPIYIKWFSDKIGARGSRCIGVVKCSCCLHCAKSKVRHYDVRLDCAVREEQMARDPM